MAASAPGALPDPAATEVSELVEGLARARSSQDQTRIAAQGFQRLLHARVAVSRGGGFRSELRELVVTALLVPRWHQPSRPEEADGGPRSLMVSACGRLRTPSYLVWRADPFSVGEVVVADTIAVALIALHLRWELSRTTEPVRALPPHHPGLGLTSREVVILELLASGLSAEGIARTAGISPRTVRKHLQHIYAKLGAHDRLVAVETARAAGLLGPRRGSHVRH